MDGVREVEVRDDRSGGASLLHDEGEGAEVVELIGEKGTAVPVPFDR